MALFKTTDQRCFIVEGNIGAGKSTFLQLLRDKLHLPIVFEPHTKWQNVEGTQENILDLFYKDTNRWAYTFQTYAFVTRVMVQQEHAKRNPGGVQILERSVFSDRYCFAKNAFEMGSMNALEWKLYQEWFTWLVENYTTKPAGFIYLQVDPDVCHDRLRKRARSEETTVSLDYLQKLHNKHERWLVNQQAVEPYLANVPVLVLPANVDFVENKALQDEHLQKVELFVNSSCGIPLQKGVSSVVSL